MIMKKELRKKSVKYCHHITYKIDAFLSGNLQVNIAVRDKQREREGKSLMTCIIWMLLHSLLLSLSLSFFPLFLYVEPAPDPPMVITTPCQSNPCTNGLYCEVNHDCIGNKDKGCSSYRCIAESVTGKYPNMTIAKTDLIHVTTIPSTPKQDCGGFVRAKINGDFGQQLVDLSNEYCKPLEYCIHEGVSYGMYWLKIFKMLYLAYLF